MIKKQKIFKQLLKIGFRGFIICSIIMWGYHLVGLLTQFSPIDVFKSQVNVVASKKFVDNSEIFVIEEQADFIGYARYLAYKKDSQVDFYLIEWDAEKFWPGNCEIEIKDKLVSVYNKGEIVCRYSLETIIFEIPSIPWPDHYRNIGKLEGSSENPYSFLNRKANI